MRILSTVLALAAAAAAAARPNFVFILTDDQDVHLGSLDDMYGVQSNLMAQGTTFARHYSTVALCCPSRVNLWTGKAAHNTNVTDLRPPYGGYPKFIEEGWNAKWLFTWLKNGGYQTYFTGKLLNTHSVSNYVSGLNNLSIDGHDFYLEPGMYQYFNTTLQHQNNTPVQYFGLNNYTTDILTNRSLDWINLAATKSAPFFLAINPVGPHAGLNWTSGQLMPPLGPTRYANLFTDAKVPRTYNFNPDVPSGASWVSQLPLLNQTQIDQGDYHYVRRLRSLKAIDDLVNATVSRLSQLGILDNTFIIYSSDNGFHIGQHRMPSGKRCPYEEDVNVPMIIRGPGVPKGKTVNYVTSHTDMVPSILSWAGVQGGIDFDGNIIPIFGQTPPSTASFEKAQFEFWGVGRDDIPIDLQEPINSYKAVRLIGTDYNLFYSAWCDGSHEIYDMTTDPGQMRNLYNTSGTLLGVSIAKLTDRLDALTAVLKHCIGQTCRTPWIALHPKGAVRTIKDALNPLYDKFYANQPKVSFKACQAGYIADNEGPASVNAYPTGGLRRRAEVAESAQEWAKWHELVG